MAGSTFENPATSLYLKPSIPQDLKFCSPWEDDSLALELMIDLSFEEAVLEVQWKLPGNLGIKLGSYKLVWLELLK